MRRLRTLLRPIGMFAARSLFPLMALAIIAGTALWGPWISLVLVLVIWNVTKLLA